MKALIPVSHGSESLETITIVNILRRADVEVTVASITDGLVVDGTRGIKITADALYPAVANQNFDLIALPGGEAGAKALGGHAALKDKLVKQRLEHRWYAAICAAPALALNPHGLLDGKKATCYPAFRDKLLHYVDLPVVVDGHCITGQGPASAVAFGLQLVECLCGEVKRKEIAAGVLYSTH